MYDTRQQLADSWGKSVAAKPVLAGTAEEPAPSVRTVRAKLKSIGDVAHELAKLYREARSGRLDVADASRLANMLYILSRILETSELEKRVDALEARQGQ